MNNDLISRDALKKAIEEVEDNYDGYEPNDLGRFMNKVDDLIDNAPIVDTSKIEHKVYNEGFKDGVDQGIKLSERPQGKWIPVSERLPDKNGRCLVTTDFGDVCMDSFVDGIFVLYLGNVVAWQPLPEPYKKGSKE